MNYYIDTRKFINKPQPNEDFPFATVTRHGTLFVVLDFSSHAYPHMALEMEKTLKHAADSLSQIDSLGPKAFLGHLAQDINNFIFVFGQKNCGGKLFCTAAISLIRGNEFWCLTYGDARINVFRDNTLLLMNGAKYTGSSVVGLSDKPGESFKEDPEQMGRLIWDQPLTNRVETIRLNDRDVVLMFSDGFEYENSPQQKLTVLHRAASSDPKVIAAELFRATEHSQDDRTLIVICGAYPPAPITPQFVTVDSFNRTVADLDRQLSEQGAQLKGLSPIRETLANLETGQNKNDKNTQNLASEIDSIKKTLGKVQTLENQVAGLKQRQSAEQKVKPAAAAPMKQPGIITLPDTGEEAASPETPSASSNSTAVGFRSDEPERFSLWSLVEIDRTRRASGVAKTLMLIATGAVLLLFFQYLGAIHLWREEWKATANENVLTIAHDDGLGDLQSFELKLTTPLSTLNGRSFSSFAALAEGIREAHALRGVARPEATPFPVLEGVTVKVRERDNLEKLAQQYKTTPEILRQLNPSVDWSKLKKDSDILVPRDSVSNR